MAQTLVNNGLPEGVSFKTLGVGAVVIVRWNDIPPCRCLIIHADDQGRPANYKRHVNYVVLDADGLADRVQGDQIISVVDQNVLPALLS